MNRIRDILIFFLLVTACHSPGPAQIQPEQKTGNPGDAPFDRHAPLVLTRHARCRMACRHITEPELHEVLNEGTINYAKSEPDAKPDPKYAVEGYTRESQHVRIIVAPEKQKLVIVTCIELGVEWQCDCN